MRNIRFLYLFYEKYGTLNYGSYCCYIKTAANECMGKSDGYSRIMRRYIFSADNSGMGGLKYSLLRRSVSTAVHGCNAPRGGELSPAETPAAA